MANREIWHTDPDPSWVMIWHWYCLRPHVTWELVFFQKMGIFDSTLFSSNTRSYPLGMQHIEHGAPIYSRFSHEQMVTFSIFSHQQMVTFPYFPMKNGDFPIFSHEKWWLLHSSVSVYQRVNSFKPGYHWDNWLSGQFSTRLWEVARRTRRAPNEPRTLDWAEVLPTSQRRLANRINLQGGAPPSCKLSYNPH